MDEVSLRVGVSKPMLYEYFASKEGLRLACVARIRADLHTATSEAVSAAGPAEEAIEAIRGRQTRLLEDVIGRWLPAASAARVSVLAHGLVGAGERVARWRLRDGSGIGPHETAVLLADAFWPGFAEVGATAKR